MSSREDILQSIRRATHVKYEKPDLKPLEEHALTYPNVVEQFYFMMKQVGGRSCFFRGRTGYKQTDQGVLSRCQTYRFQSGRYYMCYFQS